MYDFYFGTSNSIDNDPKKWLLTIKRMLPRWINGVPDSEFLALYELMEKLGEEKLFSKNKNSVLAETGCGTVSDCWDNAVAESFFHTLKVELIHGKIYDTHQQAKMAIFEYIELFYNRQRRHSYLGYLSPVDFEKKNVA